MSSFALESMGPEWRPSILMHMLPGPEWRPSILMHMLPEDIYCVPGLCLSRQCWVFLSSEGKGSEPDEERTSVWGAAAALQHPTAVGGPKLHHIICFRIYSRFMRQCSSQHALQDI